MDDCSSLNQIKLISNNSKVSTELDIELLILNLLSIDKNILYRDDPRLSSDKLIELKELVQRRERGEPLAYLIKSIGFWSLDLYVDENVLVPRPETEIIISEIINRGDQVYKSRKNLNIIDAGSGSGCIGLSIASERDEWNIILSEKSLDALKILNKNYQSEHRDNCFLVMSDWLSVFKEGAADIIVSNPPYVKINCTEIARSVSDYEPAEALFSPDGGLSDIKRIILESKKVLKKDGLLFIENGFDQSEKVVEILKENYYEDIDIILDYNNIKRFTVSRKP